MSSNIVVEKAVTDPVFRQKLKENPTKVCRDEGVELPPDASVRIIEARPKDLHFFVGLKSSSPEINAVLARAEKDSDFCNELCMNPKAVLTEAGGLQIPDGSNVFVHIKKEGQVDFVLPAEETSGSELTENELAAVSGGGLLRNLINRVCGDTQTTVIGTDGQYTTVVDKSIGPPGRVTFGSILY